MLACDKTWCFATKVLASVTPYTFVSHTKMSIFFSVRVGPRNIVLKASQVSSCSKRSCEITTEPIAVLTTLDAKGLLARQRRGASERVVLVGERPLAQAVKSFERADPITLPFISQESEFDPGNLIGRLKKRFFKKRLLLVKCVMILAKLVLPQGSFVKLPN